MTTTGCRVVFVTGGVSSSLGKGIAAASLGRLLIARGLTVRNVKCDPYLNSDTSTMSPGEHGEVFVTDDGGETDLDLGHYERFVGEPLPAACSITAGQVFFSVLSGERRGDYLGRTVQVVPHITDEIRRRLAEAANHAPRPDVLIVEIGGTVGDIEILPFLEAIRQLRADEGPNRTCAVHLTLVPEVGPGRELKTKPSQHSVAELRSHGIAPDVLLARAPVVLDEHLRRKLADFCGVSYERVICGADQTSIYAVPAALAEAGFDDAVCATLGLRTGPRDLDSWEKAVGPIIAPTGEVLVVGVVGKYHQGYDAYLSVVEALRHAAGRHAARIDLRFIDAEDIERSGTMALEPLDAIVVPGGFGTRGGEGKITTAGFARRRRVPYLGLCLGLQVAVVDAARALAGIEDATHAEWDDQGRSVVSLLDEQRNVVELGGTMRKGAYPARLVAGTTVANLYGLQDGGDISERHRHRYEVDPSVRAQLVESGLRVSGTSPDGSLVEFVELDDHPYFVATQAHPEFKSRPDAPHPLFDGLIKAALSHKLTADAEPDNPLPAQPGLLI